MSVSWHGKKKSAHFCVKKSRGKHPGRIDIILYSFAFFRAFAVAKFAATPRPIIPQNTGAVTTMESLDIPEIIYPMLPMNAAIPKASVWVFSLRKAYRRQLWSAYQA